MIPLIQLNEKKNNSLLSADNKPYGILRAVLFYYGEKNMTKKCSALIGAAAGFLNGLFGSGGGIAAVPLLEKNGVEKKKAHAESVALIMVLSAVSAVIYGFKNRELFGSELVYIIPAGLVGAGIGAKMMKKMPVKILKKIFGVLLIGAGVRMLWR